MSRYLLATTLLSAYAALPSEARLSTASMYSEDHYGYWGINCEDIRDLDSRCCNAELAVLDETCNCPVRAYQGWGSDWIQNWWDSKCTSLGETIVKCDSDIPSVATNNGFSTLVDLLDKANLVGALSFPNGPFTVLAPTNQAFGTLDSALVSCLMEPENVSVLTEVLTYHVVAGEVMSGDLSVGLTAETLNGQNITVDSITPNVIISGATVSQADVPASNGVIHVIDGVLIPDGTTCTPSVSPSGN